MLGRIRRVHFVGIGGIGMSGIAELLANLGFLVSGSDLVHSDITDRLRSMGIRIDQGHAADHVGEADVVVISSAVASSNPELVEARRRLVPVIARAEMLAELMRLRYGIAVAGSHGKTTTTSMIALMLERCGLDPTAVIGGRLRAFGSNARLGRGEYMVAEADESDRSFLKLFPTIAVVTNIDREHLENYRGFEDLSQAFVDFANKVPFYGAVVACVDDEHVRSRLPDVTRPVITYGFDKTAIVSATDVWLEGLAGGCEVLQSGRHLGALRLNVPGRHNLLNGLATVAVGLELGIEYGRIGSALTDFEGVERRFQVRGERSGVLVIDDYGHHPTEIAAVVAAARSLGRRVIVAFQPHRYTRTEQLLEDFGPAFQGVDEVVLTDIYAAGEAAIPGVTIDRLAEAMRQSLTVPLHVIKGLSDVAPAVVRLTRAGDVVITLGAGSIGTVGERILAELSEPGDPIQPAGSRGLHGAA